MNNNNNIIKIIFLYKDKLHGVFILTGFKIRCLKPGECTVLIKSRTKN